MAALALVLPAGWRRGAGVRAARARRAAGVSGGARGNPGGAIPAGVALGFEREGARLRPRLQGSETSIATLPARAVGPLSLVHAASGISVEVTLAGATRAEAEIAGGLLVYRGGFPGDATVVQRPTEQGAEDYVAFTRAPRVAQLRYELALGEAVAGLRLMEGALELLDAGGAPRLRMAPPYWVGASGARGAARVAVEGCAHDSDPRAPWGRAVTAPGARKCTVVVDFRAAGGLFVVVG